jgi:hypothetical protein
MNLDIFGATPGNNFDELNHEFDTKSISQSLIVNMPITIDQNGLQLFLGWYSHEYIEF